MENVWSAFYALTQTRGQGINGLLPITYTEIKAWMELTETVLTPWEISTLKRLDSVFIKVMTDG